MSAKKQSPPSRVPLILRRIRPAVVAHRMETHTHIRVEPRLNLTVLRQSAATAADVERVLPGAAGERVFRREEIVRHLFQSGRRQEPGAPAAAVASMVPPGTTIPPAARPLPAVLLRTSPPPVAAEQRAAPEIAAK